MHTKNLTGFYFRRTRRYRENGEPREPDDRVKASSRISVCERKEYVDDFLPS